jgi:phosphoglycolate phosphatase
MEIIIFDMDGTLLDSSRDITVSINHVRRVIYGLASLAVDKVIEIINREDRNLAMLFYGKEEYEKTAKNEFENHYHRQCIQTTNLYDGISTLINQLHSRKIRLSVATNAPSLFARRMLTQLGIYEKFDYIVGGLDVGNPKPHPEMIRLILNNCGFKQKRDRALMVGDSNKDMKAARRAGITGAFVSWGFSAHAQADIFLSRPEDLLDLW